MTDAPEVENEPSDSEPVLPVAPVPPRRSRLRRVGCGVILAIWFLLLLTPCVLVYLATQGEITISTGSVPGQELRLWLMTEDRNRGVGISSAAVAGGNGTTDICLQTDVRYLLWAGRGENASYCECYTRTSPDVAWTSAAAAIPGVCPSR